ncbi:MAG TPA: toxin-antitoxin system HicB family antitoxin [Amycolatopsis sp.]|nr:toxin-antitoxin system HicB family antitoxin [Amycolatopsis sp.]
MDLTPFVDTLREALAATAETGGDESRALAERLARPLESAARLALLDALSVAAEEITRDLAPGSVDLRLRGREPGFVVTPPPAEHIFEEADAAPGSVPPPIPPEAEEGAMARINLRLSESLKSRVEEAAARAGLSVNAWLVRAASAGLADDRGARAGDRRSPRGGQRYTGWVR